MSQSKPQKRIPTSGASQAAPSGKASRKKIWALPLKKRLRRLVSDGLDNQAITLKLNQEGWEVTYNAVKAQILRMKETGELYDFATTWTPLANDFVANKYNEGWSYTEIAQGLRLEGYAFSRSAVAGKVGRLRGTGLLDREKFQAEKAKEREAALKAEADAQKRREEAQKQAARKFKSPNRCKYIFEGEQCRNTKQPGREYCATHHWELKVPINSRRGMFAGLSDRYGD